MNRIPALITLATALGLAPHAGAADATFTSQVEFMTSTSNYVVENFFDSLPDGVLDVYYTDAQMDAIYGETMYHATAGPPDAHRVSQAYYDGRGRSVRLTFTGSSLASGGGVYAFMMEYTSLDPNVVLFVTFADATTAEHPLPTAIVGGNKIFGVTSDTPIESVHVCYPGDTPTIFADVWGIARLVLAQEPEMAITPTFTDRAAFLAATTDHVIEDYEGIPNGHMYTNADMDAFYDESNYESTYLDDRHQVCAGYYQCWNVSTRLTFDDTSITSGGGVHAVGLEFANYDDRWVLFFTRADGTTEQWPMVEAVQGDHAFFGVTSESPIVSLHICALGNHPMLTNGAMFIEDVILGAAPTPACVGDLDGDDDTDVFDFNVFAPAFGSTGLPPFTGGDLDGDGDVDVFDFNIFAPDFGCGS